MPDKTEEMSPIAPVNARLVYQLQIRLSDLAHIATLCKQLKRRARRAPLTLSNPTNGAVLGTQSAATLEITDDATEPSTNSIDDAGNFVRQHYHDFLNREPDQPGWDFWTDNITKCHDTNRRPAGQTVDQCIDKQRETTSGAFFLSPEFQYSGYYVYCVYKGSLGRMPTFLEFTRDVQEVSRGMIVADQVSASTIESNRAQYLVGFVQRAEFANIYGALNNQDYVDKLFMTTGISVSSADKQALVAGLNGGTETPSSVLHKVVNGTRVLSEGQVEVIALYGKAFLTRNSTRPLCRWNTSATCVGMRTRLDSITGSAR